jgi:hypothetical protein
MADTTEFKARKKTSMWAVEKIEELLTFTTKEDRAHLSEVMADRDNNNAPQQIHQPRVRAKAE